MLKQGEEPEVEITISVPESLSEFIGSAIESGSYMWVLTYQHSLKPGTFEHARTIRQFPVPEILGSLEKHKEEFTQKVIQPHMAKETATIVDDAAVEKQGLKVIEVPKPGVLIPKGIITPGKKAKGEHTGWE